MKGNKKFFLILFMSLTLSLSASDRDIFYVYFNEARDLYKAGLLDSAQKLLGSALEFWESAPDGIFLQCMLDAERPGQRLKSAETIKQLAKNPDLNVYSTQDAYYYSGIWYFLSGDYAQAYSNLSMISDPELKTEEYSLYFYNTLLLTGREKQVLAAAKALAARYKDSFGIQVLCLKADPLWAKELASRILDGSYDGKLVRELTLALLAFSADDGTREALLIQAKKNLWTDPEVTLADLEFGYPDREKLMRDLSGFRNIPLRTISRFYSLLSDAEKKQFDKIFGTYTGEIDADRDMNGMPETRIVFTDGMPQSFMQDANQDRLPEIDAAFSKGIPSSVRLEREGISADLEYGIYPALKSVSLMKDTEKRIFYLADRMSNVEFPQAVYEPWKGQAVFGWNPDQKSLVRYSDRQEVYLLPADILVDRLEYIDGVLSVEKQSSALDGRLDTKILYNEGVPYLGFRDLDMDGRYDITQIYENGILTGLQYQEDGQKVPELVMTFIPARQDNWDLNDDGIADLKVQYKGALVIRSFSSGLNGVFDVILEEQDKIILAITSSGKRNTVSRASDGLYWVGTPGGLDYKSAKGKSGRITFKGKKYFIFSYNDNLYARQE